MLSSGTEAQTEKIATKPSNLAKDDLETKAKPEEKIHQKVKKKLEVRFKNGEINRKEMKELEEYLVAELTAELLRGNKA